MYCIGQPANTFFQCQFCRKEMVSDNKQQLADHALTHDQKVWVKEKCFPSDFQ